MNTACARVAPSASAPSRIVPGTSSSSSSVVRAMIGIIMMPSAMPPARALKCLNGSTAIAVDEYADHDRRHAVQRVGGEPDHRREPAAGVLRHVDTAQDADRDRQQRADAGHHQRADDGVGHAAAGLANRLRHPGEEVEVERLDALA